MTFARKRPSYYHQIFVQVLAALVAVAAAAPQTQFNYSPAQKTVYRQSQYVEQKPLVDQKVSSLEVQT